jgi:hypothetical protein
VEVSEIRKRLLQTLSRAKQEAAARRARVDRAAVEYERFLDIVAGPVFRQFAGAIKAEGYVFTLATPPGGLRLESERSREDVIEIELDITDAPLVMGRTRRGRGHRVVSTERPIREGAGIAELTEEDVLAFLLEAIVPFVER